MPFRPPSLSKPLGLGDLFFQDMIAKNVGADRSGLPAPSQNGRKPWYNRENHLNKFDDRAGYRPMYAGLAGGITFENNVARDPHTNRSVDDRLADLLEAAAHDVVGFNINSTLGGRHSDGSAHYDGRAADIHCIGSMKEKEGLDVKDPKARPILEGLIKYFAAHPEVRQIIGPTGGWNVFNGRLDPITDPETLATHKGHLHVGMRRR